MIPQSIEIYTDGSCHTQHKVGAWASIILLPDEQITLKGEAQNTSHHRMEMLAVINSIEFTDKKEYKSQLMIYTDSQYVCGILRRKEKLKANKFITKKGTPIQNADLVQILIQQIESHNIQFIKVKAHQKDGSDASRYNSEVDKLSRKMVREIVTRLSG